MPHAPPTCCPCGGRRTNGVCSRCGPKRDERKSAAERGYDADWEAFKESYLRDHPLCVCCEAQGIVNGQRGRAGLRVDHIVPLRLAPERRLDPENVQTLCLDCDLRHKRPLEKRCRTAEQVVQGWAEVMERMKKESAINV